MKFLKLQRRICQVFTILTLTAAAGRAAVIYDFVGSGFVLPPPNEFVAFVLTSPNFVNPALDSGAVPFTCAQLSSSTNCGIGVSFGNRSSLGASSAELLFEDAQLTSFPFDFPTGAFGNPGVYTANTSGNTGTLTVTATPEPGTMILLLSGLCLGGFSRLRASR